MILLWIIFSLHTMLADTRTLSEGEAIAFKAVFGTSDMKKLQEIERDPAAYWEERKKALQDVIPHLEFCKIYTEDAKTLIRETSAKGAYHPWFSQDPNAIEEALKLEIPEDHPAYPTLVALYTALGCDHLHNPEADDPSFMATKEEFMAMVKKFKETHCGISHDLNARKFWTIGDANFSIFDYLILFSEKKFLCGAPENDKRLDFFTHIKPGEAPLFSGVGGPIRHDVLGHALPQHNYEGQLRKHGVSCHEYFRQCWNKETLVKDNIIRLAQGAIGCFYQFHELPSIRNAKEIQDKESLLFMKSPDVLSDFGFCAIVPYFTNRDADFNWHTQEIKPDPSTNVLCEPVNSFFLLTFFLLNQVKLLLECWRTASCYDAAQELLREERADTCDPALFQLTKHMVGCRITE